MQQFVPLNTIDFDNIEIYLSIFSRKARRLLGSKDESPDVVDEEAGDDDIDDGDENEDEATDAPINQKQLIPIKKRKISKPDEYVCTLAGCPSAASGHKFKNATSLRKHQV